MRPKSALGAPVGTGDQPRAICPWYSAGLVSRGGAHDSSREDFMREFVAQTAVGDEARRATINGARGCRRRIVYKSYPSAQHSSFPENTIPSYKIQAFGSPQLLTTGGTEYGVRSSNQARRARVHQPGDAGGEPTPNP